MPCALARASWYRHSRAARAGGPGTRGAALSYRPSWIVISPAGTGELRRVCAGYSSVRFVSGDDVVAAYQPEPGAQGPEHEIARSLASGNEGRHYALTLAN